jgi:tetratricopeptide (TPR) repeat protein
VGGALQLGSEEGIGASLVSAMSGRGEDAAQSFLRAATKSALEYHTEEVHANERFQAALAINAGTTVFAESDVGRRLDGEATQCTVTFKVGRSQRTEAFELLSPPELRAVLRAVLDQLGADVAADDDDDGSGQTSLELLKPFKMAWASPRVFWNLARAFDGDVPTGLRTLVPDQDWGFLDEREKRRSGKAISNAVQAAEAEAEKAARKAKRQKRTGSASELAEVAGENVGASAAVAGEGGVEHGMEEEEEEEYEEVEGEGLEEEEELEEPEADDADGWEAVGRAAMLRGGDYDYACECLNRALLIRVDECGGREVADETSSMASVWYLHGSALLRRAQAMAMRASEGGGATAADAEGDESPNPSAAAASVAAATEALGEEWRREGCAAIGRRVRRFFALHGLCDGEIIAWQEETADDAALYRVAMDDGDVEDLSEEELDEALEAHRELRTTAHEVELLLEAAWEALEMAVALYSRPPARPLGLAEAHERLGDAALQNQQPERALAEYGEAHRLLVGLKDAAELPADDRRMADIQWFLGVTHLQLGHAEAAMAHYQKAAATLRLRRANLQRAALDREVERLQREAESPGLVSAAVPDGGAGGAAEDEVTQIDDIIGEIEARMREVQEAAAVQQQQL